MNRIVYEPPEVHRCYDELYTLNWRKYKKFEYGTVIECSCGARYRLEKGNFFTSVWDAMNGRNHVVGGRSVWDRWVRV